MFSLVPEISKSKSSRPDPVEQHRAGETNKPKLRRARFFGTHAPRDKENQPEKCRRESTPETRCCFGATHLVGELPRSNGQTTAWPSAPSRAKGDKIGERGGPEIIKSKSRRPDPVEQHRAGETNKPKLRRARFFGTHAPRDKENQPEKCRRESTPETRCCFGATHLVGELPRSNGQTTAWPSAPSRAKGDKIGERGGPEIIKSKSRRPDPVEQHRAGETNKPKLRRARFFGTHAPRDKENQPEKCRRESTPETRCCFGATHLVGELPRSNGQTTARPSAPSRAKGDKIGERGGTRCCFGATHLVGELPRSNGQTTAWPSAPSRAKGEKIGERGGPDIIKSKSRRPDPVEQHRAGETNKPKLRRARFFGTHAPRDKENQPEKCRRESTPETRCCFGATHLVGELPRS